MTISRRQAMKAGVGTLPLLGLAGVAAAQQPPVRTGQAGQPATATRATGDAMMDSHDPPLAACLLIKGRKQIEVCQFALTKLHNADVKAFAQAEIDEHQTMKTKLQALGYEFPASPAGSGTGTGSGTGRGAGTGTGTSGTGTGVGGAGAGTGTIVVGRFPLPAGVGMMIAINREVGEQCIATTKSEQAKLTGLAFDKRFVGSQLDAHYDLFDHGVVFKNHASAAMVPLLDEARTIIERHINICKQLMEKLDAMR